MAAWHEPGAASSWFNLGRKVKQLNIKTGVTIIYYCIYMQMLAGWTVGCDEMNKVMVKQGVGSRQGLDDSMHLRKSKHLADRRRRWVTLGQRTQAFGRGYAFFGLGNSAGLGVKTAGPNGVTYLTG